MRALTLFLLMALVLTTPILAGQQEDRFWEAARQGDVATIKKLHQAGVDLNVRTEYGATALSYACDRNQVEVVRYLVENGADVNTKDDFYKVTAMGWSLFKEHFEITKILLAAGAEGAGQVLLTGVAKKDLELIALALKSPEVNSDDVDQAMEKAREADGAEDIVALLENADVKPSERKEFVVTAEVLNTYVGAYRNDEIGMTIDVRNEDGGMVIQATGQPPVAMRPLSQSVFEAMDVPGIEMSFSGRGDIIEVLVLQQSGQTINFPRVEVTAEAKPELDPEPEVEKPMVAAETAPVVRSKATNWPGFRGIQASGVADGQGVPATWNVTTGENVRWKTPIPGLGNSSPVIWGDRIFVTTAISTAGNNSLRTGNYGDVDMVDDDSEHIYKVYGLSTAGGEVVWEQTVAQQVPGAGRHLKSTQANSTPVTDGKRVVALFGAVGLLVAYDLDGNLQWKTDVGTLDAGWFYDRSYSWGHASSPVIHGGLVIVQADIYADSFIAAYSLKDGREVWKTERESIPSWGTPTVYEGAKGAEVIANGPTIRGYDLKTGKELWSLSPNSEVTVATPIIANDMFYVTAGYPPARPVYAIRPGSRGDISLPDGAKATEAIAWSKNKGGTYMPTPIVYGEYLYTCANNGRLTAYNAVTGEDVYRQRLDSGGGAFTASPVATDGRIYFTAEDGDIIVARAGAVYEELARNDMGEVCMSTPAISDGLLVIRTAGNVYGIGAPLTESEAR